MNLKLIQECVSVCVYGHWDLVSAKSEVMFGSKATEIVNAADDVVEVLTRLVQSGEGLRDRLVSHRTAESGSGHGVQGSQVKPHVCLGVEGVEDVGYLSLNGMKLWKRLDQRARIGVGRGKALLPKNVEATAQMNNGALVIAL